MGKYILCNGACKVLIFNVDEKEKFIYGYWWIYMWGAWAIFHPHKPFTARVILNEVKDLATSTIRIQILRRFTPQNDTERRMTY